MKYSIYLIAIVSIFFCQKCSVPEFNPNIILINVDDLGWADLGCYGSTYYETPNIDALAAQSVRYTQAYAAAAVCSPTRAAIMTGKAPARLGITDWIRASFQGGGSGEVSGYEGDSTRQLLVPKNPFHLNLNELTIAEYLKQSKSYATAHIGKWHLGTESFYPEDQGFDVNIAGCDYGQPPTYFDPYIKYPRNPGRDTIFGFPTMEARLEGEYLTDREADEASAFIRSHKEQPFFLNLCHYAVHTPIQAKDSLVQKYEAKPKTQQKSATYAAMVESVDQAVGQLLNTLEKEGLIDRTIIIFTSDNGGLLRENSTNNYPLRSGKGYPYEGGIRVPMIIHHPQLAVSRVIERPVISTDLFATICDFVGINPPKDLPTDGESLFPGIATGSGMYRNALYWHFPHYRVGNIIPFSIVRHDDWKLIKRYEGPTFELYNLGDDPYEENDLKDSLPAKVEELNFELETWLTEVGAKLPKQNPDYKEPELEL